MAKNKKSKTSAVNQQHLSPEKYLRSGAARKLEKGNCYVSEDIEDNGEGIVVVSRQHNGGRVSAASFLLDTFCLGVKDTHYMLRMSQTEFEDYIDQLDDSIGMQECSYDIAHNWVWGAVAWAEDGGIAPHKDFAITQMMLDDDTDDVPLINLPFGHDGKHLLLANDIDELQKYMPILRNHLNPDEIDFSLPSPDPDDFDKHADSPIFKKYGPDTEYTYQHPDYPTSMELRTPQFVYDALMSTEHFSTIEPNTLDRMLALPHDDLRHDLEQMILYHIGQTCDEIPDSYDSGGFSGAVDKAVMLLGEVGDPGSSLEVVLEVLRQNREFYDYHHGDIGAEVFEPTLYLLGRNRLDKIMEFVQESGLYTFAKAYAMAVSAYVVHYEPKRRAEAIEWYGDLLRFATRELPHTQRFDSVLSGLLLMNLIHINAYELLPEIKVMFDTGLVDLNICGDYREVVKSISRKTDNSFHFSPLDIGKRFEQLRQWEEHYYNNN